MADGNGGAPGRLIGNAEPPPKSICLDGVASARSVCTKSDRIRNAVSHLAQISDLAADMHVGPVTSIPAAWRHGHRPRAPRDRNPNLFSDFPVAILAWVPASTSRIDRIESARLPVDRELRQQFQFGLGLDVDAENVGRQAARSSAFGLADARETESCRANPGRQRTLQLTPETTSRRREFGPACAAPTGWNSPSWRSRPASSSPANASVKTR